ncbi:uncharacterized protein [Pyrus communis]|uniref:uncharacterized protein n=1 Tax=Pyrus communis TaxID=23211 RepID=UPI0035C01010
MPLIQLTLLFPVPLQVSGTFSQWKMIVQMCQWFWKYDYKFTYIQSTNSISMHTTRDTWICSNLSDKHYYEATTICEYLHTFTSKIVDSRRNTRAYFLYRLRFGNIWR